MIVDGGRVHVGVEPIKTPSGTAALESSITIKEASLAGASYPYEAMNAGFLDGAGYVFAM